MLICGATGFIGRNCVNYYQDQGYRITAVYFQSPPFETKDNVHWVHADLRDPEAVEQLMQDKDIVIQAAATTSGAKDIVNTPHIHVTDNAVMNSYLLKSANEMGVKHFIFFSCTVMYPSSELPVSESGFTGEVEPKYFAVAHTKTYIENMCRFFATVGKTRFTVIRHSNVYGPFDKYDLDRSHVFGATLTKVMLADEKINVWGTGEEIRDLLYIDDLIDFMNCAIDKQTEQCAIYNCGSGQGISINDLVRKIIHLSGKQLTIDHDVSKPTIPFNLVLNTAKAKQELGWQVSTDLDQGIEQSLRWWQDNIDKQTLKLVKPQD